MKIFKICVISIMAISLSLMFSFDKNSKNPNALVEDVDKEIIQSIKIDKLMLSPIDTNEHQGDESSNEKIDEKEMVFYIIFLKQIDENEISRLIVEYGFDGCEIEDRQEYRKLRLKAIKELTLNINNEFIKKYEILDDQILYFSTITTTLIININQDTLDLMQSDPLVNNMSLFVNQECINEEVIN